MCLSYLRVGPTASTWQQLIKRAVNIYELLFYDTSEAYQLGQYTDLWNNKKKNQIWPF